MLMREKFKSLSRSKQKSNNNNNNNSNNHNASSGKKETSDATKRMTRLTSSKSRRPPGHGLPLAEDEKDDVVHAYKSRIMVHDIHRVRELSALLEERRRYFDGQLGEVYRNAGVSSPSSSLPRLRGLDSPPISASASDSNVTDLSLLGSELATGGASMDMQSACSGRSYSVFADDECSVADSYEFAETKARLGRNWSSSTLLGPGPGNINSGSNMNSNNNSANSRHPSHQKFGGHGGPAPGGQTPSHHQTGGRVAVGKDSIYNEVMRTADLEKKLKARRSSLPLALEASLKRPLKKKILTKTCKSIRKDGSAPGSGSGSGTGIGTGLSVEEQSVKNVAATLLTKTTGYPDFSDGEDYPSPHYHPHHSDVSNSNVNLKQKLKSGSGAALSSQSSSQTFSNKINVESRKYNRDSEETWPSPKSKLNPNGNSSSRFSMTEVLSKTREYDLSQDVKGTIEMRSFQQLAGQGQGQDRRLSGYNGYFQAQQNHNAPPPGWDADIVGGATRRRLKKYSPSGSKSASSALAPLMDYSPRSSLSTLSGNYPRIAFSSLEKYYREEGDRGRYAGNPSHLLLKPVPKIDMNMYAEPTQAEPDYSHDFRFLSLLDALVPCVQPSKTSWKPQRTTHGNHPGSLGGLNTLGSSGGSTAAAPKHLSGNSGRGNVGGIGAGVGGGAGGANGVGGGGNIASENPPLLTPRLERQQTFGLGNLF